MTEKSVSACAGAFKTAHLKIVMQGYTAVADCVARLAAAERMLATASGCDPAVDPLIIAAEAARADSLYFATLLDRMDSPFVFGQVGARIHQVVATERFDCMAELEALLFDACTIALCNQAIARHLAVKMVTQADGIIDDLIACYEVEDIADGTNDLDALDPCPDPGWRDDLACPVTDSCAAREPAMDLHL
jgi:hypothetical protein